MTKRLQSKKIIMLIGLLVLMMAIIMTGCSSKPAENTQSTSNNTREETLKSANGKQVNFYMWGGDTRINKWVPKITILIINTAMNIALIK